VAEETQHFAAVAVRGPEVLHRAEVELFAAEAGFRQAFGDQRLAAGVVRRHRGPGDQVAGQGQYVAHFLIPKRSL
jgi:hypothetical protein